MIANTRYAAIADRAAGPLLGAGLGALAGLAFSLDPVRGLLAAPRLAGLCMGLLLLGGSAAAAIRNARVSAARPADPDWIPLHGATLHRDGPTWHLMTIPNDGGYSASRPLQPGAGPVEVVVDLEVESGRVGVALLDGNSLHLHERMTWGEGRVRLHLRADDGARVRTLLVRNMATRGRVSRVRLGAVAHHRVAALAEQKRIETGAPPLALTLRHRVAETEDDADRAWRSETRHRPAHEVALVIVDAWAGHEIAGWHARAERNMRDRLAPLVMALRHAGVHIVHAAHDVPVHKLLAPQPGDMVLEGLVPAEVLAARLRAMGVRTALYAGYKSNMCVLTRPVGLLAMVPFGIECALVRDASLALETPWSLADEAIHAAMVDFVELNICPTAGTDELIAAAQVVSAPGCAAPSPAQAIPAAHR